MLTSELFVSSPIIGIPTTSPHVQGQVGPLVQDFDQVVLPGTVATGSGEAHVSTEVDYGLCRLGASLEVNALDFEPPLSMDGGTRATGSFSDFVTINAPGLMGTSGTFVARIDLDGSFDASASGEDLPFESSASADMLLTVSAPGFEQRSAGCSAAHGFPLSCTGVALGVQVLAPMPFTYGTPFELTARIDVTTFQRTVPNGATSADASFEATVQWLGFQQVRDSGGATVASYSVTSTSGTDWSQPIPEPESALAGFAVLLALAVTTRRRGSTTR